MQRIDPPRRALRLTCDHAGSRGGSGKGRTVIADLYRGPDGWTVGKRTTRSGARVRHDAGTVLDGDAPADPRLAPALAWAARHAPDQDMGELRERFTFCCRVCGAEAPPVARSMRALASFLDQWADGGQHELTLTMLRRAVTTSGQ